MINVILFEPEIPPNTGNVIRLCANTGASLHLVEPLGFDFEDAKLRRAGLDYHEFASMSVHASWQAFVERERPQRMFALTTRGELRPSDARLRAGDWFVFGRETAGLAPELLAQFRIARAAGDKRLAGQIIDDLAGDVLAAAIHAQSRALRGAA